MKSAVIPQIRVEPELRAELVKESGPKWGLRCLAHEVSVPLGIVRRLRWSQWGWHGARPKFAVDFVYSNLRQQVRAFI